MNGASGHALHDRERAFEVLLRCFADSLVAETAAILERPQRGGTAVLAAWAREGDRSEVSWARGSLLDRAFESVTPLLEPDGAGAHRAVAAGVRTGEGVIGAIWAGFEPATERSAEELLWAAESYGRLAALCMDGDQTIAAVLASVGFDTLTGCLGYGGLVDAVRAELQRSVRHDHRLSCCFIDLDGFKAVNDEAGHMEGNRLLSGVGAALRSAARPYDSVGRFGGDEFVVVLPETGAAGARRAAERLLVSVRTAAAELGLPAIDASIGVVEWDGRQSAFELLEAGDRAMQVAKAKGGGRLVVEAPAQTRLDGLVELTRQLTRPLHSAAARADEPAGPEAGEQTPATRSDRG